MCSYESTKAERGELTSLEAALERAKARACSLAGFSAACSMLTPALCIQPRQERLAGAVGAARAPPRVYYYVAQSRDAAINSPYLEAFAARGIEARLAWSAVSRRCAHCC